MRSLWQAVTTRLAMAARSKTVLVSALGLAVGFAAVAVRQQFEAAFGVGSSLDRGVGLGILAGLAWGIARSRRPGPSSRSVDLICLGCVIALWPWWLSGLMDVASWVPVGAWQSSWTAELLSLCYGVAAFAVPVALWTSLASSLEPAASVPAEDADQRRAVFYVSIAAALLGGGGWLAPVCGVWWPALAATGVAFVLNRLVPRALSLPERVEDMAATAPASSRGLTLGGCLVAAALGLGWGCSARILGELFPTSGALTLAQWAWLLAGIGLGRSCRWPAPSSLAGVASSAAWVLLCLFVAAPWAVDLCLWQNSYLTSPQALWVGRLLVILAAALPIGWVYGRLLKSGEGRPPAVLGMPAAAICGQLATAALLSGGVDLSVVQMVSWGLALAVAAVMARRERPLLRWSWAPLAAVGCASWLTAAAEWDGNRAVRLLFSTNSFIAARSGWDARLLPTLEDLRVVAVAEGQRGRWTVWQSRGAQWQLREAGVPRGVASVHPEWLPEHPSEVVQAVWPLVLVEQPARVLTLGVGSGTTLKTCLGFPIREVVCCEADDGLLRLVRGPLAERSGGDPAADPRVAWRRQPAEWLALPASERFDVILSSPPSAALSAGAATCHVEFYARAARHLTPQGVFCQRFDSIDFGPEPLLTVVRSMQLAFEHVVCVEAGAGEFLLLGARSAEALVRTDLPQRLEMPHVSRLVAACGWDWSFLLNVPAYDGAALAEAADERKIAANRLADARLACRAPWEILRWGAKLQETSTLLGQPRATAPAYPLAASGEPPLRLVEKPLRKARYLEWIGAAGDQPELLRRLAEVATQRQLIAEHPDAHWWEYRRALREQLQEHPRTGVLPVSHTRRSEEDWHPEDRRRRDYFEALGAAADGPAPTEAELARLEALLEPYDPLLTLFAHQELAELYARAGEVPQRELAHRLHLIYYAPAHDASVRNVVAAIDLVAGDPQAVPDPADRFDVLNGLLQVLRARWENRNVRRSKSARVTRQEVDRSLVSVERALTTLETLAPTVGYSTTEWRLRRTSVERLLAHPFRTYRDQLAAHIRDSEAKSRQLLQKASAGE